MFGNYKRAPLCLTLLALSIVPLYICAEMIKSGEHPLFAMHPLLASIGLLASATAIFHYSNKG